MEEDDSLRITEKLKICKIYYIAGFFLLPFLWIINFCWFYNEAFRIESDEKPLFRKYTIRSLWGSLVMCIPLVIWQIVFQLNRVSWGHAGENLTFVLLDGKFCLALAQVYDPAMTLRSEILKESMLYNDHHHLLRRSKRGMKNFDVLMNRIESSKIPNDPLYQKQWYLKNDGSSGGAKGLDLNVQGAWKLGFTGRNVTVAILDDGIDYTHKDLYKNYYHEASYDYSSNDHYPYPRYTDDWFNSHGTRCAGEIAAAKDNGICGVGVAYNARIAGIRMLDQSVMTDIIEAKSLSHKPNLIDIYSVSWGPVDNGKIIDGPRIYTQIAMLNGINNGRHGKGSIYVWASGDGGIYDDCNCDGYTNSMWTISINSAIINGETAIYDESCSSTLASTFSNSGSRKSYFRDDSLHAKNRATGVATTDLYGRCTVHHSGTSASAPQAAGVFAITLESNPSLTWRDIQHLTVLTTDRNHLHDRSGTHLWKLNGAGLEFNHLFGFGVLNAEKMVKLAKLWKPLPERTYCMAGAFTRTM
ncbi:hypothetical protein GJ496_007958 [Pomphorhynchus laevis]|nr:hypothetical protein GJ496_007958 [Pomphorhynchus laevis]